MWGVHREIMDKVDEIDTVVKGRDDLADSGLDQKIAELRRLVQRCWNETGNGLGGFGGMID